MDGDVESVGANPPADVQVAAWIVLAGLFVVALSSLSIALGWGNVAVADVLRAVAAVLVVIAYYLARFAIEYHRVERATAGDGGRQAGAIRDRFALLSGLAVAAAVAVVAYLVA